jgi:tetraacyldisaccharide 4'-kinase
MQVIRILLIPLSLAYGLVTYFYHWLYDRKIIGSRKFDVPVIAVGNLTTGGTGKTPHVEYMIRLLNQDNIEPNGIATLSRGYGRVTSGFILAQPNSSTAEIGDEPRQFRKKFSNIHVAVNENRVEGVQKLLEISPNLKAVLLDDAFQHRRIHPGMSILLMDYQFFSTTQYMLPTGNLREPMSGMIRADVIVVTNTPAILSPLERRRIGKKIDPKPYQSVYHSHISYGEAKHVFEDSAIILEDKGYYFESDFTILLFTGIANPSSLVDYYKNRAAAEVLHLPFADHHEYTMDDMNMIREKFNNIANEKKVIFTTEKDAMRLTIPGLAKAMRDLPVFYLPIRVEFNDEDELKFNKQICDYVGKNQKYSKLHSGSN